MSIKESNAGFNPNNLARQEILSLHPYESSYIPGIIKMDANENPFSSPQGLMERLFTELALNRYPDAGAVELKQAIANYTGILKDGILVGNGSDEVIQMILTAFGGNGKELIIHPPTFGMYQAAATVTGMKTIQVPLLNGLDLDEEKVMAETQNPNVSVIILCSPNNPTGTLFDREQLLRIIKKSGKIVVIDEAYAEFSKQTLMDEIKNYPNLLVMRTFSKAFGLAGLRLGYLLGQPELIQLINRVRQPFNVNVLTQRAGVLALSYLADFQEQISIINQETQKLYNTLVEIPEIDTYPTHSNFILFKPVDADRWAQELFQRGFLVRNMGQLPVLGKCLRVSPALPEQNEAFIKAVKELAAVNL